MAYEKTNYHILDLRFFIRLWHKQTKMTIFTPFFRHFLLNHKFLGTVSKDRKQKEHADEAQQNVKRRRIRST